MEIRRTNGFCAVLLIGIALALTPARADEPTIKWVNNLDVAKKIAVDQKKDILINFTGHGWCYYCTLLDRAVFSHAEFAAAAKNFVLVELDFPSADDEPTTDLKSLYAAWKKQYQVQGIPTVVIVDSGGRPYAYTGYEKGITASKFLENLSSFRTAREVRDSELSHAAKLTGLARAQKLHAAIQAVSPLLGTLDEHDDDFVLVFYGDVVGEIQRLDANNASGLRKAYDDRVVARKRWHEREWALAAKELERFNADKNWPAAIAYIEVALPNVKDQSVRWRLKIARHVYLEWDQQWEKALEDSRQLLNDPQISKQDREKVLEMEAGELANLGAVEKAIESYDRRIHDAAGQATERQQLLWRKAQLVSTCGKPAQKIAAWRDFRAEADAASEEWKEATAFLATELRQDGQHKQAIELNEELLTLYPTSASLRLDIAESQQALGALDAANKSIDLAEGAIKDLAAKAKSPQEISGIKSVTERIAKLRKSDPSH